jgi:BirA family biotin operon repressor/biotin-[acetyl-CoA-carboxylase] ligase
MLTRRATQRLALTRFSDVRWLADVDSTNAMLLQEARSGAPEGVVVVADHQTAGRGRLGRRWEAPAGASLLVSVLLRPAGLPDPLPVEQAHLVTAAAGLAAVAACVTVAGLRPELKWPNDLMSGGRKLAGILAEAELGSGPRPELAAVVVGMGLNVTWHETVPAELTELAVALNHLTGQTVDRADLLVAWLVEFEARYGDLAAVADEYRRVCATVGRNVRVALRDESFDGVAVGITAEGHLLVDSAGTTREVAAGDVVHLRPAP